MDIASLVVYLVFFIVEVFTGYHTLAAVLAGLFFLIHTRRLGDWYAPDISHKPLL